MVVSTPAVPEGSRTCTPATVSRSSGVSLGDEETEVLQGIGLWLPSGPEDYAIPDLALVDSDFD